MKRTMLAVVTVAALALTLAAHAEIDLLSGGYFAPADAGDWPASERHTKLRWGRQFLLYVVEPGEVTVTVNCERVGKYQNKANIKVMDPAGNELASATAEVGQSATVSFAAPQVGPYELAVDAGRNGFTLEAEGARLLMPAGAGGQPFSGVSRSAPIYLFVPPGSRSFHVLLTGQGTGETAKAHVLGPDGHEVALLNTTGKMRDEATVEVPRGAHGKIWCITIEKGDDGVFEDFAVRLSGGVSPYVSEKPGDLICPILNASSMLVSREARDPLLSVNVALYAALAEIEGGKLMLSVRPFDGGDAVHEKTLTDAESGVLHLGPQERLDTGKYTWELTVFAGKAPMKEFAGTWWYVPKPDYLTEDGVTLVNGEPFFARGLYHVEPQDYELVKAHGFNCVQTHAKNVEAVEAAGLKAGVALYWGSRPNSEAWRQKVLDYLDNPAVFAWWIQDEPDGGRMSLELLADSYSFIRTTDPNRPAYTCLNTPSTYREYAPQTDIVSMDVYPIPRTRITRISDTLEHAQAVIPKHVHWFIGQVWSPPNAPRLVAPAEHRCMTYLALAHGARGLFWYSFSERTGWYLPDDNPQVWAATKVVNAELAQLEPVLLTPNLAEHVFEPAQGEGEVHTSLKRLGDDIYVFAVNPTREAARVSIDLAQLTDANPAAEAQVLFENRSVTVEGGIITEDFDALAVHIYKVAAQ